MKKKEEFDITLTCPKCNSRGNTIRTRLEVCVCRECFYMDHLDVFEKQSAEWDDEETRLSY